MSEVHFMKRSALARRWGTSVKTVIRQEKAGKLTPIRSITATVRYPMAEIEALEAASVQAMPLR